MGAILLVAIVLGALVTVRVSLVPAWERDAEADHMENVATEMVQVKSALDRLLQNASSAPFSVPVDLQRDAVRMFGTDAFPHALSFEAGSNAGSLTADLFRVQEDNGEVVLGASEDWQSVGATQLVEDVSRVFNLRVRITDDSVDTGDEMTVTVRNADGEWAGDLTLYVERDPPENYVNARIRYPPGPPGTIAYEDIVLTVHQTNWASGVPYWVDLLDPSLRFVRLIDQAVAPITLELLENPLQGDFTIAYTQFGSGIIVGGGGRDVTGFARSFEGGSLTYHGQNNQYLSQDVVLENGALIVSQHDGASFKVPPGFAASLEGGLPHIDLSLAGLTSEGALSFSGPAATVTMRTIEAWTIRGLSPAIALAIQTQFPTLWADHIRGELGDAGIGLVEGAPGVGEFQLTEGATSVTVTIWGPDNDPADADFDLFVTLAYGSVDVEVSR